MAIDDLPTPLVNFLNIIGIEWPYINEDSLHQFATLVRGFGQAVDRTHQDATGVVSAIAQAHQGASTAQMKSGWAELSSRHVTEIVDAAGIAADALDAWAVYVVAQKLEAIAQMVELAVSYFAAIAAAPETLGASLAALPGLEEIGEAMGNALLQTLQQYALGQVMNAALKPFLAKFESLMSGLDWSSTGAAGDAGGGFQLDEAQVRAQISTMRTHVETMKSHGSTLRDGIAGLSF
ncbi:hypothetical protein KDL01_32990 [Actinospica durhamensis]|uniref:Outer membrane channel protein CpnT-like N-terminal domain-containing protein n=1 Tax=Actinospica durhamensis TaxID=1508375 RepID=A0A941EUV4_9ACTN|nr:hypothetical protein [Actinospica durhamensis]MBR7838135.1 hypothetical protein [Actinospica durhamensis]